MLFLLKQYRIKWSTKGANPQRYYTLASYYKELKKYLFVASNINMTMWIYMLAHIDV